MTRCAFSHSVDALKIRGKFRIPLEYLPVRLRIRQLVCDKPSHTLPSPWFLCLACSSADGPRKTPAPEVQRNFHYLPSASDSTVLCRLVPSAVEQFLSILRQSSRGQSFFSSLFSLSIRRDWRLARKISVYVWMHVCTSMRMAASEAPCIFPPQTI